MTSDPQIETRSVTAYISVYNVNRQFGGHEEGGWWYDSYEWLKVSIPFHAFQDYIYRLDESEDDVPSAEVHWKPYAKPYPRNFQTQVRVQSFLSMLEEMYGEETKSRGSVLSDGDIEFIIERDPGERERWPRPRYE